MNYNLSEEDIKELRSWRKFQDKLNEFKNKVNLRIMTKIFKSDAERLLQHLKHINCDTEKFKTYLTTEQYNIFLSELITNKTLYA